MGSRDAALELLSDGHTAAPLVRLGYLHSLRGGRTYFLHFRHQSGERDYPQVHLLFAQYWWGFEVFYENILLFFFHFGGKCSEVVPFVAKTCLSVWDYRYLRYFPTITRNKISKSVERWCNTYPISPILGKFNALQQTLTPIPHRMAQPCWIST